MLVTRGFFKLQLVMEGVFGVITLLRVSPFWDLIYSAGLAGKKSPKYMFRKLVTWNQCLLVIFLYLVIIGIASSFSTTFFFYI